MTRKTPDTFARRLAALRESIGITAYELAKRSGVSKQALSRLERGESKPSLETALKLCKAMGKSLAEFDALPQG